MVEIKDDPREVLELLNSLGFIGITAPQLKAFMKDLKMYRKVKERERQRRKEEMKKKILSKQQSMVREILSEHEREFSCTNSHKEFSDSTALDDDNDEDDSVVEVKIKCIPKERKTQGEEHVEKPNALHENRHESESCNNFAFKKFGQCNYSCPDGRLKSSMKHSKSEDRHKTVLNSIENTREVSSERYIYSVIKKNDPEKSTVKPMTPPVRDTGVSTYLKSTAGSQKCPDSTTSATTGRRRRSKSVTSDRSGSGTASSVPPTRGSSQSGAKSFIRPWRLQPDAQKATAGIKKCDPVTLYQKYQQEWKQISFPGEEKHASVRWAVREKLLGTNPHPVPIPKKSSSMPVLKRK